MKHDIAECTRTGLFCRGADTPLCPHLADDAVIGYMYLALTEDEETRVWDHLQNCTQCSSDMERLLRDAAVESTEVNEARTEELGKRLSAISDHIEERTFLRVCDHEGEGEGEDMKEPGIQSGDEPDNGAAAKATITSFAQEQISLDTQQKEVLAQWAAEHFRLTNGAGVLF